MKNEPKHYDNTNGSLYQFCEEQGINSYEFDIIKRVMRCRKKGNFLEDLEKTKFLIDLYIKEQTKTKSIVSEIPQTQNQPYIPLIGKYNHNQTY